ncbi:MAG: hypothetical protein Tsb009_05130 [Planctomycetaceae bacterium]
MKSQDATDSPKSNNSRWRFAVWLLTSLAGIALLAFLAAHAPARVRLLGLFALGFGMLLGALLAWLMVEFQVPGSRRLSGLAAILIALGMMGMVAESYRVYVWRLCTLYDQPVLDVSSNEKPLTAQNAKALGPVMKFIREARQEKLAEESRFVRYVERRTQINQQPAWEMPWPWVLLIGECVAGFLAGTWVFHVLSRRLQADIVESVKNEKKQK